MRILSSAESSSATSVVFVTVMYSAMFETKRYAISAAVASEMMPPVRVASVRSRGTFR